MKTAHRKPAEMLIELKGTQSAPALDALVERYFAMVYCICLRITRDRHDAEDATQAAFLCLARQLQEHRDIRAVGPWLHQVASNASTDICRKRKRRAIHEPFGARPESAGTADDPATNAGLAEIRPAVLASLNNLPTRYRLPLILHYFGGLSPDQLARELTCTRNALRVRLHRGHKLLRKSLEKQGITLAGSLLGLVLAEAIRAQVSDGLVGSTIALGHQVGNWGLSACSAGPDVLSAASQAIAPAGRAKLWIVVSLAAASILAATAPLLARLRDLPTLPSPMDIAPFKLPELTSPLPKLSSAGPLPPASAHPIPSEPGTPSRPSQFALAASPAPLPSASGDRSRDTRAHSATVHLSSPATATKPPAQRDNLSAGAMHPPVALSTPLARIASDTADQAPATHALVSRFSAPASHRAVQSHGSGSTRSLTPEQPTVVAATLNPSTNSPWSAPGTCNDDRFLPASTADLITNDGITGRLAYYNTSGSALDALFVHTTGATWDAQVLTRQFSVSTALSDAAVQIAAAGTNGLSSPIQPLQVIRNNGQVIADRRIESYTWCSGIQNDVDNPHGGFNGWFAMHGGRVNLPPISIQRGTHTYNWGEDASDTTIDLINSIRITTTASASSDLAISLLATDTPSLPLFPAGHHFISVWEMAGGSTIVGPMPTTVRYDDARLTSLGLDENCVKLWYCTDFATGWQRAYDNFGRDTANDWVCADIPAGVQYIAVSTPEPASLALLGTGALLLLRRSRRT